MAKEPGEGASRKAEVTGPSPRLGCASSQPRTLRLQRSEPACAAGAASASQPAPGPPLPVAGARLQPRELGGEQLLQRLAVQRLGHRDDGDAALRDGKPGKGGGAARRGPWRLACCRAAKAAKRTAC
jgi:hypothetical protein